MALLTENLLMQEFALKKKDDLTPIPTQFEIIGLDRYVEDNPHYGHRFTIKGEETYARILIKKVS